MSLSHDRIATAIWGRLYERLCWRCLATSPHVQFSVLVSFSQSTRLVLLLTLSCWILGTDLAVLIWCGECRVRVLLQVSVAECHNL